MRASPARRHVFLVGFPRLGRGARRAAARGASRRRHAGGKGVPDRLRPRMDGGRGAVRGLPASAEDDALEPIARPIGGGSPRRASTRPGGCSSTGIRSTCFKLPLIARLFPDARVLFARRDPGTSCSPASATRFADERSRLAAADPGRRGGLCSAATMEMAAASETAFGLYHAPALGRTRSPPGPTARQALCDFIGLERTGAARRPGAAAGSVGKWRDYARRDGAGPRRAGALGGAVRGQCPALTSARPHPNSRGLPVVLFSVPRWRNW